MCVSSAHHFFQLLPHTHHGESIEMAVVEQGLTCLGSLVGWHVLDGGENSHGMNKFKVCVRNQLPTSSRRL